VTYTLLDELAGSQLLMIGMLRLTADDDSARIGAWSLRDMAAHLAATERDCYEPRIRAIAAGHNPRFDYFTNDDADFDGLQLDDVLEEWVGTRERLIAFIRDLDEQAWALSGYHERYGEVTVEGYLQIALAHDRDHLRALEQLAGAPKR